jgi:hypothetical protein
MFEACGGELGFLSFAIPGKERPRAKNKAKLKVRIFIQIPPL